MPQTVLSMFRETPPGLALSADAARELAAGLIRGAELAERYATGCPQCGKPMLPDDGLCVLCQIAARRAAAPRLVAVDGETVTD